MLTVNCWEMITALTQLDKPISEKCKVLEETISKGKHFANEFEFSVEENGAWVFRIFNCFEGIRGSYGLNNPMQKQQRPLQGS